MSSFLLLCAFAGSPELPEPEPRPTQPWTGAFGLSLIEGTRAEIGWQPGPLGVWLGHQRAFGEWSYSRGFGSGTQRVTSRRHSLGAGLRHRTRGTDADLLVSVGGGAIHTVDAVASASEVGPRHASWRPMLELAFGVDAWPLDALGIGLSARGRTWVETFDARAPLSVYSVGLEIGLRARDGGEGTWPRSPGPVVVYGLVGVDVPLRAQRSGLWVSLGHPVRALPLFVEWTGSLHWPALLTESALRSEPNGSGNRSVTTGLIAGLAPVDSSTWRPSLVAGVEAVSVIAAPSWLPAARFGARMQIAHTRPTSAHLELGARLWPHFDTAVNTYGGVEPYLAVALGRGRMQ